jgi:hypothetical protein
MLRHIWKSGVAIDQKVYLGRIELLPDSKEGILLLAAAIRTPTVTIRYHLSCSHTALLLLMTDRDVTLQGAPSPFLYPEGIDQSELLCVWKQVDYA